MNLFFWKKTQKKNKQENCPDLLLPQDKKEIKKLDQIKSEHLDNIQIINQKIALIQNSTGTLIPKFSHLHHKLRQKYKWYYYWHTKPYSKTIHWFVLLLYLISLPLAYYYLSPNVQKSKATTYSFPRWEWSNPKIPTETINQAISCSDNESYWVAQDNGVILYSGDKGATWRQEYTGAEGKNINSLACVSSSNIVAVGDDGLILQYPGYHDGWTQRTVTDLAENVHKVIYLGESGSNTNLIAYTSTGKTIYSHNGGTNWSAASIDLSFAPTNITSLSSTYAIAIGNGKMAATRDGGETWIYPASDPNERLFSITRFNSTGAIAVGAITGAHSHILKITLSDTSFSFEEKQEVPINYTLGSVDALSESRIMAVGYDLSSHGKAYASLDGGDIWSEISTSEYRKVIGLDSSHAITCGPMICNKWTYSDSWSSVSVAVDFVLANDGYAHGLTKIDENYALAFGVNSIYTTANGGTSWTSRHDGQDAYGILKIVIPNPSYPDHLIGFNTRDTIFSSNNAGLTWTHYIDTSQYYSGYTLYNNKGLMVANEGFVWSTEFDGNSWNSSGNKFFDYFETMDYLSGVMSIPQTDIAYVNGLTDGANIFSSKTSNGGDNWGELDYSFIPENVDYLDGSDANVVAVADTSVGVSYTTDSTASWTSVITDSNIKNIKKIDANNALAVGDNGKIYRIIRGTPWTYVDVTTGSADLNNIIVLDSSHILTYALSGSYSGAYIQTLLYSGNGGNSWDDITVELETKEIVKITQISGGNLVAIGNDGATLYSSDYGSTWTLSDSKTENDLNDLAVLSSNKLFAVGANGTIVQSADNGTTWTLSLSGTQEHLGSIVKADEQTAYAAGGNGAILKYSSPVNWTATQLLIKLPGQSFTEGSEIIGTPNSVQAGDSVTATIYAVDNNNNRDLNNASWAGFTSTDPNDTNPPPIQLTEGILGTPDSCIQNPSTPTTLYCGIGTTTFVFHTAGTWTVTTSDIYGVLASGTSSSITVTPGDPAKLAYSGLPSSLAAGEVSAAITVKMTDQYGNATTSSSSKTIALSSTSDQGRFSQSASGPWSNSKNITLPAGSSSATFYYYDNTTGTPTISASSSDLTTASGVITITAGQLTNSTLEVDKNSVSAGESLTATVTLKNNDNITLPGKSVQLLSSRNTSEETLDGISPSSTTTDTNGVATFSITPTSVGNLVLSAYDQSDNAYIPQEKTISVNPGSLSKLVLESSVSQINPGTPFNITASVYDSYDNLITNFTDEVFYSSSDNEAKFSNTNYTFSSTDDGKHTQTVKLYTSGDQTVSAASGTLTASVIVSVTEEEIPATATPSVTPSIVITTTPSAEPQTLVETLQESPIAQKIAKTLSPITATVATLGLLPLLVQAFPQGFHVLASLFPAIFTATATRRRRKPWGIVYDSFTEKPIDLAVVRVFSEENDRLVATKVTDQNGRFSFILQKGKYYIKVNKVGYIFPPKISKLKASQLSTRFGPQSDIYFGQSFVVGANDTNINLNIGLDPKIINLSFGYKLLLNLKNGFDWFLIALSYISAPLMLSGAVLASITTVIIPSTFNLYMCGFYGLILVGYLISHRIQTTRLSFIFDSKNRKPIPNATVSIFDKEYNSIREIKTTDQQGHFTILAQKGQYYLTVQAKGYKFPAKDFKFLKSDKKLGQIYFGETINNKKASFVNVSIPMEKD